MALRACQGQNQCPLLKSTPPKSSSRDWSQLTHSSNKGSCRLSEGAVATIGQTQFPPQLFLLERDQLDASCQHLIAREAGTDKRNTQAGRDKTLDHANARQFHAHL